MDQWKSEYTHTHKRFFFVRSPLENELRSNNILSDEVYFPSASNILQAFAICSASDWRTLWQVFGAGLAAKEHLDKNTQYTEVRQMLLLLPVVTQFFNVMIFSLDDTGWNLIKSRSKVEVTSNYRAPENNRNRNSVQVVVQILSIPIFFICLDVEFQNK